MPEAKKHLLILGATGMVGGQLLRAALADPAVARVTAPTRRPLPSQARLDNPVIDFHALPTDCAWWQADALLCALGSTLKQAGSRAAFRAIDHDLVLHAAQLARRAGTPCCVSISSLGASTSAGSFYLRTKGDTEAGLAALGFDSLQILRPALLDSGPRPETRPAEQAGLLLSRLLRPLIPARYQPISAVRVAECMLGLALAAKPGSSIIESEQIAVWAQGK
ncbi:MAG: NAD-dependent dehydratase [Gammaproteobacteria bacterium HGW-Gammaproteobacteria-11]|nr:MAG: NAD-dependent dehydratase [Gammaproteobacteria bacterium HGW-Gammaproteobacteria-11]